jgi:hypothetical protein
MSQMKIELDKMSYNFVTRNFNKQLNRRKRNSARSDQSIRVRNFRSNSITDKNVTNSTHGNLMEKYSLRKLASQGQPRKSLRSKASETGDKRQSLMFEFSPHPHATINIFEVFKDKNEFKLNGQDSIEGVKLSRSKKPSRKEKDFTFKKLDQQATREIPKIDMPRQLSQERSNSINSSNSPFCKICYEKEETSENKLIDPCICQGSMRYVHQDCLKTWIFNQEKVNPENAKCEICKTAYLMRFNT